MLDVLELHVIGAANEDRLAVLGVDLPVHVETLLGHRFLDLGERLDEEADVVEERPVGAGGSPG